MEGGIYENAPKILLHRIGEASCQFLIGIREILYQQNNFFQSGVGIIIGGLIKPGPVLINPIWGAQMLIVPDVDFLDTGL